MYDYLVANPIVAIVFVVIGVIIAAIILVKIAQTLGLERIRGYVYQLFIEAEREFQYGDNEAKFEYVICLAKSAIPVPFNLFITESLLRTVVQAWFDICKDLLDDGKINGISKD